jgi:hypothetical protein
MKRQAGRALLLVFAVVFVRTIPLPARAQPMPLFIRFMEEVAETGAGRAAIAAIVGNGTKARAVLSELGIYSESDTAASGIFKEFSSSRQAEAMIYSDTMAATLRSEFGKNFQKYENMTATINTARLSATSVNLPRSIVDKSRESLLSLDIATGELKLTKPLLVCSNPWCEVKLEKLPIAVLAKHTAVAAIGCELLEPCSNKVNDWLRQFMDNRANIVQLTWLKCGNLSYQHWCSLAKLNIPTGPGGAGVFFVWRIGESTVVSVGGGDIGNELAAQRKFPYHDSGSLRVTWALAAADNVAGIEKYLIGKFHPLFRPQMGELRSVTPIQVNLPGSG